MDRSTQITLISETHTKNSIGLYIATETTKNVYAAIRSIGQSEWFDAGRNGLKPEITFIVFKYDYEGERLVEYNNKRYSVYRTYETKDDLIELHCELKGGVHEHTSQNQ